MSTAVALQITKPLRDPARQEASAGVALGITGELAKERKLEAALAAKQIAVEELEASRALLLSFHENSHITFTSKM